MKFQLEKVKSDFKEGENLIVERQKLILLSDKSELGWTTVEENKQHNIVEDLEDKKLIYSAQKDACTLARG